MRSLQTALAVVACTAAMALFLSPASAQNRIVAIGGSVTEILYALDVQDRIVGVDSTSLYPAGALSTKANIGYMRAVSAEGVLSLNPDLVIAIEGAGPPAALSQIEAAGAHIERVPDRPTEEGLLEKVRDVGALVGKTQESAAIARDIQARFRQVALKRDALGAHKRVLFILSMQGQRPLAAGRSTAADGMIALAGGENAASELRGYKQLTDESVVAAAPDVVLMMNNGARAMDEPALFALPAFALTPAARHRALILMEGNYLLGFGPRAPHAASDLLAQLYGMTAPSR